MCVCAHQVRENVCVRMCCVTLHFRADIEGPLFGRRVNASRMALSPQAQISLSYLTQQILCKSSHSVTGKLIISGSSHPILPLRSHLQFSVFPFEFERDRFNKK